MEQVEGVRFRELFARLPQRAASGDEALQKVIAMAQQAAQEQPSEDAMLRHLLEMAAEDPDRLREMLQQVPGITEKQRAQLMSMLQELLEQEGDGEGS